MLRRLKSRLTVATKALRPLSLYSVRSSTNSDSTDRDSVHSDPSHILSTSNDEDDIYSPVEFGAAPYEVALASRGPQTTYDAVEYCSRYDIYGEYGFDSLYEPVTYITEVRNSPSARMVRECVCVCVCPFVCYHVFCDYAQRDNEIATRTGSSLHWPH